MTEYRFTDDILPDEVTFEEAESNTRSMIERIKRNPVVLGGLALSALEALTAVDGLTLRSAVPVLVAVIIRFFTAPSSEVEAREDEAYFDGLSETADADFEVGHAIGWQEASEALGVDLIDPPAV